MGSTTLPDDVHSFRKRAMYLVVDHVTHSATTWCDASHSGTFMLWCFNVCVVFLIYIIRMRTCLYTYALH